MTQLVFPSIFFRPSCSLLARLFLLKRTLRLVRARRVRPIRLRYSWWMRGLAFVSFLALIGLFISLTRFLYIVLSS